MAKPSKSLRRLRSTYATAEEELVTILEGLFLNNSTRQKAALRIHAVALIQRLRLASDRWLDQTLTNGIARYDREVLEALEEFGVDVGLKSEEVIEGLRASFARQSGTYFDKVAGGLFSFIAAITAVRASTLAVAFPDLLVKAQSSDPIFTDSFFSEERDERIKELVTERIRSKQVPVRSASGRVVRFPLSYYGTMIGHSIENSIATAVTIARAREFGWDVVRVSSNPSKHGDYCDAYAGKVFSLSGITPGFTPVSMLPNGGPPFHPWCEHRLELFNPASVSAGKLNKLRSVPDDLLLTGPDDTVQRIDKEWRSRGKV